AADNEGVFAFLAADLFARVIILQVEDGSANRAEGFYRHRTTLLGAARGVRVAGYSIAPLAVSRSQGGAMRHVAPSSERKAASGPGAHADSGAGSSFLKSSRARSGAKSGSLARRRASLKPAATASRSVSSA